MMHAIALIYLFGNKGIVSMLFLKLSEPFLHGEPIPLSIYGPVGIVASQIIYTFPQVFLILSISLSMTDNRLYEAAETLGASRFRQFITVTLPSVKYGLINSVIVGFIMGFTDFGSAKVIGGNFNVLATDIYKHVIGQQNMSMGATVGILLLVPSVAAFIIDRVIEKRQNALVTSRSVPYRPIAHTVRDKIFFAYCTGIACVIATFLVIVAVAALVRVWPYRLDLTLAHFSFDRVAGGGFSSFVNSVIVSAASAVAGVSLCFPFAYLVEKCQLFPWARRFSYFMALVPLALPGLVIGLSFIFMFNTPQFVIPLIDVTVNNPLTFMYGTPAILVISNIVHFMSVPFISATSRLRSFDREIENVSESLGVSRLRTFSRITLPMSLPAVFDMASYFFINSMVTVSAVIFLYSPHFRLASVAIVNMDDAGDTAEAAAMSALIILTNIGFKIIYEIVTRRFRTRSERWMKH
jgi:iron(III) transport system permease protein